MEMRWTSFLTLAAWIVAGCGTTSGPSDPGNTGEATGEFQPGDLGRGDEPSDLGIPDELGNEVGEVVFDMTAEVIPETTDLVPGDLTDAQDVQWDAESVDACIPDCSDKECGADGCGGSCGQCDLGLDCVTATCTNGKCEQSISSLFCVIESQCVPSGTEKPGNPCLKCRPELAQDVWSHVEDGTSCGEQVACHNGVCCVYDCEDKECGEDGCGGLCGTCAEWETCEESKCLCSDWWPEVCYCDYWFECESGYCIDWIDGDICTGSCLTAEDCPEGWACIPDEDDEGSNEKLCVPRFIQLCKPCKWDHQCHTDYGPLADLCVSHGDSGSFCGVACEAMADCPPGYECEEVNHETGLTSQCVPSSGECDCTDKFIMDAASTTCYMSNDYGSCSGQRFCAETGLTECDATIAKPEECNGLDDNCDGEVDPANSGGCSTYYWDNDGDGYGIGAGECLCEPYDPKQVTLPGDCDDASIGVNPSIEEACNYLDDDCDGETDESFANGCETMYYDGDNDGYGDAGQTDCLCKENDEYTAKAGDCDDEDPLSNPGSDEQCDDVDNDCDTVVDEENAVGCTPHYLDQDKDGHGLIDQFKCLCQEFGDYAATMGGDCDDTEDTVYPGAQETCDSFDNDCDGNLNEDTCDDGNLCTQDSCDPDLGCIHVSVDCPLDEVCFEGACCEPNCGGKECGSDGCGSICGYCDYGYQCVLGICEVLCIPQCEGKQCGYDGCYGECPPGCQEGFHCGDDGLCYWDCDVIANCEGKECGPDGCGGSCGDCGIAKICNEQTGLCEDDPCGDIDKETGACTGDNVLVECLDGVLVETPCQSFGEDYYCNWDGPSQKFVCSEGCVPQCTWDDGTPKQCGYDGCYGECGTCPLGWTCEAGTCFPVELADCGWITDKGECIENKLWFCSDDILYVDDCDELNKTCQFDMTFMAYKCM